MHSSFYQPGLSKNRRQDQKTFYFCICITELITPAFFFFFFFFCQAGQLLKACIPGLKSTILSTPVFFECREAVSLSVSQYVYITAQMVYMYA